MNFKFTPEKFIIFPLCCSNMRWFKQHSVLSQLKHPSEDGCGQLSCGQDTFMMFTPNSDNAIWMLDEI